ncbi:MAG: DUF937 domain-containing protein [Prevotella sp.]|jgi:hypothetical protein|nr:DUF937 domain-containing protein [Prevotella sp.]
MLDNILNIVKEQASNIIAGNSNVPEEKKQAVVDTTAHIVVNELQNQLSSGNISQLTSLLGGDSTGGSSIVNSIENSVSSALTSKVGLNSSVATSIASAIIPAVMNLLNKKSNDPNDSFNIESLIQSFTGSAGSSNSGGILGKLGSLFGK